jgi:hypothetical protein
MDCRLHRTRTGTITYPSGRVVTETKDLRDRLWTVGDSGGVIATYSYDPGNSDIRRERGRLGTRTYSIGVVATYTYNANNWMTALDHSRASVSLASFTHAYDKEGTKRYEAHLHNPVRFEDSKQDKDTGEYVKVLMKAAPRRRGCQMVLGKLAKSRRLSVRDVSIIWRVIGGFGLKTAKMQLRPNSEFTSGFQTLTHLPVVVR